MSAVFPQFDYLMPKTIDKACSLLFRYKGEARVTAGGTDLMVLKKNRCVRNNTFTHRISGRTTIPIVTAVAILDALVAENKARTAMVATLSPRRRYPSNF